MIRLRRDSTLFFTLPVVVENIATLFVSLIYSSITSRISGSALAAMGTVNTIVNFMTGFTCIVTVSSAVLVSRLIGERDYRAASEMTEQSVFLATTVSVALALVAILLAKPVVGLLSPNAEASLMSDTVSYYIVIMASLPFLVIFNNTAGVLRASGNSTSPFVCAVLMNGLQLALAYLFINVLDMGMTGAGLAFVGCRIAGAAALLALCFNSRRVLRPSAKNCLRPKWQPIRRMLKVGIPGSIEQMSVQGGYMLGNTLVVGLGTMSAAVYNVVNTVNSFPSVVLGMVSTVTVTAVGNLIGAGEPKRAKKKGLMILLAGGVAILLLYGAVLLFAEEFCRFYTEDEQVLQESLRIMPFTLLYLIPAVFINVMDPALRTGGDTRFVMLMSSAAVWLVRLPLTLLLCYRFEMGAFGALLANYAALVVRMTLGFLRYLGGKWLSIRV